MGWRIDLPQIRVDNPVNTLVDVALYPVNAADDLWNNTRQEFERAFAAPVEDLFKGMDDKMDSAAQAARVQALNDTLNDRDVDDITKAEIQALYDAGADSGRLTSLMAEAKEGKGIYAIRRINYNQKRIAQDQPGRMQLAAIKPPNQGSAGPNFKPKERTEVSAPIVR